MNGSLQSRAGGGFFILMLLKSAQLVQSQRSKENRRGKGSLFGQHRANVCFKPVERSSPTCLIFFCKNFLQGGTGYKAKTEMEMGKAKYLSVQVNFGIQSNFIHALFAQSDQHSVAFTFLTIHLCYRTISLSLKVVNQEVSNRILQALNQCLLWDFKLPRKWWLCFLSK